MKKKINKIKNKNKKKNKNKNKTNKYKTKQKYKRGVLVKFKDIISRTKLIHYITQMIKYPLADKNTFYEFKDSNVNKTCVLCLFPTYIAS